MVAQSLPMPKSHGLSIIAAAVRDGEYRCKGANDTISASSAMAHRYLTRDPKDGNLFRPGENAVAVLARARELGKVPDADALDNPAMKVAVARDPHSIDAGRAL